MKHYLYILPFNDGKHFKFGRSSGNYSRLQQHNNTYGGIDFESSLIIEASKRVVITMEALLKISIKRDDKTVYEGLDGYTEVRDVKYLHNCCDHLKHFQSSIGLVCKTITELDVYKYKQTNKRKLRDNRKKRYPLMFLTYTKKESNLMMLIISRFENDKYNYSFTIKELLGMLKVGGSNWVSIIDSVNGLYDKPLSIECDGGSEKVRLLSKIKMGDNINPFNESIEFTFNEDMNKHLMYLKKQFSPSVISSFIELKTLTAKKLYMVLLRYKLNGSVTIGYEKIQKILGTNYKTFSILLHKNIKPALKEIQKKTDLTNIKIITSKTSRKITSVEFKFNQ